MRNTPRRRLAAASLAGLAVLAAGCRGDDGGGGGGGGGGDDEIATDVGITSDPCPEAVNEDNGCIYLGTLSDLTVGPFAAAGPLIGEGQKLFWDRVNEDGGIGGYDIDVTEYVRDNQYNPQVTNQVYQEIKPDVLALAQTLGSPTTAAIVDDLDAEDIVAAPAGWTSLYLFQDVILESGGSYCVESMNGVDYAVDTYDVQNVMAVHYPGDYGGDSAAGAKISADANGLDFANVETTPGTDNQAAAVAAILEQQPDLVVLGTAPADTATIVGQAVAGGYQGRMMGASPSWNPAILQSPAAPAFQAVFEHLGPWGPWDAETEAHQLAREALGDVDPNEFYLQGWFWSLPAEGRARGSCRERRPDPRRSPRGGRGSRVDRLRGPAARGLRQLRRRPERGGVAVDVHQQHQPGREHRSEPRRGGLHRSHRGGVRLHRCVLRGGRPRLIEPKH